MNTKPYGEELKPEDFKNARILLDDELISPLDYSEIFKASLYCILSSAQNWKRHTDKYHALLEAGLDSPPRIVAEREKLVEIMSGTRFPNQKVTRIYDFSLWYPDSGLADTIVSDSGSGRKEEFSIRNWVAEQAPGMAEKCASLLLIKCGYQNVVPIDLHMIRFLNERGHEIPVPNYTTRSGPKTRDYLKIEKAIIKIAGELEVTPTVLQFAIWSKLSTWKEVLLERSQLELF